MTYRASQTPLKGGFSVFRDFVDREYLRIQRAFATKAEVEQGVFTPTFDFATTGDLSGTPATQDGYYWLHGNLLHYHINLSVTPTHTTASGNMEIGGFPYPASADNHIYVAPVLLSGTGITWPTGGTSLNFQVGVSSDFGIVRVSGSGVVSATMAAADVGSGTALTIRATGFYQI